MAKEQNGRVNLNWSPARWRKKHNRRSRAAALIRLTEENVTYNLSAYQAHLPERFPGYLIRTSRRLGAEGLRQDHCVASYHHHVRAGRCAIASMFVERQRYTVELVLTGNPDHPVRIEQVKGRHGKAPSHAVLSTIHRALKIQQLVIAIDEQPDTPTLPVHLSSLRRILPTLRELNIEAIEVNFEGSGDTGSIDEVTYKPPVDTREIRVHAITHEHFLENNQWFKRTVEKEMPLDDAIIQLTDDYQQTTNVNWWDENGGNGTLTISVHDESINLVINLRHDRIETAFEEDLLLEDYEQVFADE